MTKQKKQKKKATLPRGLVSDRDRFRIRFLSKHTRPGMPYQERLPPGTKQRKAEVYLNKLREDDRLGQLLWPEERKKLLEPPPAMPSVGEFATETYLPHCEARNSPATMRCKRQAFEATAPWFWAVPIDEVNLELALTYQQERKVEGVSNRTVNMQWETIRHLVAHAHKLGKIPCPPPTLEPLPTTRKHRKPFRWLTETEATQALENAADKGAMWYALTLFLLSTGARWGESQLLRWSDVDFDHQQVYLRAENAKHGRDRLIPLLPELIEAMEALPRSKDDDRVWMRRHYITGAWIHLKNNAKAIGGRYPWQGRGESEVNIGPHVFRHTFATWRLQRGEDLGIISAYLGHASVALTKDVYGHIKPTDRRETIENAPRPQVKRLRVVGDGG